MSKESKKDMRWPVEDEIMKHSIISKISKLIEDNENNATETLNTIKALIASEESKPDFTKIKDGEHFTYKGIEFIRLGKEQGGILCITAKIWKTLQFDKEGSRSVQSNAALICLAAEGKRLLGDGLSRLGLPPSLPDEAQVELVQAHRP